MSQPYNNQLFNIMGCGKSNGSERKPVAGLRVIQPNVPKENKLLEAKIVLLGDTGVGKSSIATRFSQNKFQDSHEVTIGGAYFQHQVTLANGTSVKMHIWDTGGAERFRTMTHIYYKDANAAILAYDITHAKTLDAVKYWVEELTTHTDPKKMVLALAANKCDLTPETKFIVPLGKKYAEDNNMIFKETSAKTGTGVSELFKQIIDAVCAKLLAN